MATVANVVEDWASGDPDKITIVSTEPGVIARWVNEAQLRFADRTESIRGVWTPTVGSTGIVAIPSDFLREIKDLVKWSTNWRLRQIDYATASLITFSGTNYYSIWNGNFYVWTPASGSPSIAYIKKPTAITVSTYATADLEIPTEYQRTLFVYFDAQFARRTKDLAGSIALMRQFDAECDSIYQSYIAKNDPVPMIRGTFF